MYLDWNTFLIAKLKQIKKQKEMIFKK